MACHLLQNYSLQWAIAISKPTRFFTDGRLGFFAQPSWFFHWTNLVSLQNRLNCFTEPSLIAWTEPSSIAWTELNWFFYRIDSIILQSRLDYFTEPTRVPNQLRFFFIVKQGARPQPPIVSCKRTPSSHMQDYWECNHTKIVVHHTDISDVLLLQAAVGTHLVL